MNTLKDIKLVSRDTTDINFQPGKMTIDLGGDGNPVLIDDLDALDQDVLKAIFTGARTDGYGTVIKQVIGDKNLGVVQAMLTYTVIGSLQKLISIHNDIHERFPTQFRFRRMLANLEFLKVDNLTVTSVKVRTSFRTRATDPRNLEFPINAKD